MICYILAGRFNLSRTGTDTLLVIIIFYCGLSITPHRAPLPETGKDYRIKSKCEERLSQNNYILSIHNQLFYLHDFNTKNCYQKEDSLFFHGNIYSLPDNSDIEEFSYTQYLQQKGVYYQVIPFSSVRCERRIHNLYSFFETYRQELLHKTSVLLNDPTHAELVNALCLGFQTDMDRELLQLFSSTGTIHLLSVSGLHCGAIYLLIAFLFKIFKLSGRRTNLLIIPLLWGYALLTGLSPSVIRAATILSFLIFSKAFNEDYTPLNAIAASAFFTLLIKPLAVYSVSFQMSYAAYTGIIVLYPLLNKLPGKLPKLPQKLYFTFCVTIAAQLPTLPICAYYFHTVNINSFLVNIIAIPATTLLLYSATILLLLPLVIGIKIAFITNFLCNVVLYILQLFDHISINLSHLYPSGTEVLLIYLVLLSIGLFLIRHNKQCLRLCIISTTCLLLYSSLYNYRLHSASEVVVFSMRKESCILLKHQGYYSFLKNSQDSPRKIMPYIRKNKLLPASGETSSLFPDKLTWHHNLLKSPGISLTLIDKRNITTYNSDILIITDNIMPSSVFGNTPAHYPGNIIVDASNTPTCILRWENFCNTKNIRFCSTVRNGSIRLTLK